LGGGDGGRGVQGVLGVSLGEGGMIIGDAML